MKTRNARAAHRISDVAARYGIHPQTLRLYEREGLLSPRRTSGNTRYYTRTELERLEVILSLSRDLGVNLAGIEVILNMRARLKELVDEVGRLSELLAERTRHSSASDSPAAMVRVEPRSVVRARTRSH